MLVGFVWVIDNLRCLYCISEIGICPLANTMLDTNSGKECSTIEPNKKYATGLTAIDTGIENIGQ